MEIRTAHSGGSAVRWAYGVFLTLCLALAVLAHHEMCGMDASPMQSVARAAHMAADETGPSVSDASPHSADDSGCAMPGMQHCTAASIPSVQLALPNQSAFDLSADLSPALSGRAPGSVTSRAPPDLSVLSQLRI
ncbi:DUF6153 family protein [Streptomyces hokutonensis]|uniref:DUF6153 family protein n=1 Tax=Streptomyces hokutonensis TaxID=1306990 RepID=UPI0037FA4426